MGAGKSTVGRVLARHLSWQFSDTDHVIEQQTGVGVPVVFEIEGEAGFRKRESLALNSFLGKKNQVLATGGGIILLPENRALLKQIGTVVYLRASPYELYQRTRMDKNRPLLQSPNPRQRLEQLLLERRPYYEEVADLVIETGRQSVHVIAQKICSALNIDQNASTN